MSSAWEEFNGEYEKYVYDIELKDGTVHEECYPNTDKFIVLHNSSIQIPVEDVKKVRVRDNFGFPKEDN